MEIQFVIFRMWNTVALLWNQADKAFHFYQLTITEHLICHAMDIKLSINF